MDESLFTQEDSNSQMFQMDSKVIIEDFLLGTSHFDQEDAIYIIEEFCGNLKNISN